MLAKGIERLNKLVAGRQELKVCFPTHFPIPHPSAITSRCSPARINFRRNGVSGAQDDFACSDRLLDRLRKIRVGAAALPLS
jgi:hypothetical protein